jgi:acyl dehydratase
MLTLAAYATLILIFRFHKIVPTLARLRARIHRARAQARAAEQWQQWRGEIQVGVMRKVALKQRRLASASGMPRL